MTDLSLRSWPCLALLLCVATGIGCSNDDVSVDVPEGDLEGYVSDISVSVHPHIGSILVVTWEQLVAENAWVEYSFDDVWLESPRQELLAGPQEQILLGIPYGTNVLVRLVNELDAGATTSEEVSISNDSLPSNIPLPTVVTSSPTQWDPDRPFLLTGLEDCTVILDRQGRVVWKMNTPFMRVTMQPQVSHDGADILIDHGSYWAIFDGGNASQVIRVKIDGTILQTYDTPGMHHPFTEIADGSIVWAAMDGDNETLEKLTPGGQQESIASCLELLGEFGGVGYCGTNTIRWNESTDSFVWSLYSHDTVFDVDHSNGQAIHTFGHHDGAWDFDPVDSAFWWQHGSHYTAEGTLLTSSYRADGNSELVVREYELDEDEGVLREIWNFGIGEGIHATYMGEAHRLPGGNTLHNYGSTPRLREVLPNGTVVWDLEWEGVGGQWELGRTTPIADLYALAL